MAKIGSTSLPPPVLRTTSAAAARPATTTAQPAAATDSFSSGGTSTTKSAATAVSAPTTTSAPGSIPAMVQTGIDALNKAGGDDASQLATLLAKQSPTDDDITNMCDLYDKVSGLSDSDKQAVGAAISSREMTKGFIDQMLNSIKNMDFTNDDN